MNPSKTSKNIEWAHRWLVKAVDALNEAQLLSKSGRTRLGAYNRLYYASHHTAVALLRLIGNTSKTHTSIIRAFGSEWVKKRKFPPLYGKLLNKLHKERDKADYGEYVPTIEADVNNRIKSVRQFIKRAQKEVPPISIEKILKILVTENDEIKDFSFDFYCPRTYKHHTRVTIWCPRGRITQKWLITLKNSLIKTLKALKIREAEDYVLGLNSRVNQYNEKNFVMLDFDNVSTVPAHKLRNEPGFLFRTASGFHFIGIKLYTKNKWIKKMKKYLKISSPRHCDLSIKRGYATIRISTSRKKPFQPVYMGRIR